MKVVKTIILILILLVAHEAFAQSFDLQAFADSTKYGWKDYRDRAEYREDLTFRQNKLQLYELEAVSLSSSALKSAVIPGWGQFVTKHNTKATVILSAELVTVISALYFYNRAKTNYDRYYEATQIDQINDYWSKAETPYHYSLMMVGLAGIIWIYNMYDVVISTNEYNANLWQNIIQRSNSPLQLGPNGIELRF
ncbi:MAG: hypothetical protein PHY41_00725 [Candidatus Cloacimonetes bacterium]|jgi:hypothetical protein|nr:hypothetical protein [Candidatus Cloacimonadota bacterium]MDY0298359.1 hypothetical protein [Candidatus Cloacimonadaceae bacterium]MCB5278030.1 hypothetical protein [Candidatus Cloacimonadota bacterium]MCK9331634.1 hypothetical protein [Candidatus Cloacimonadota bacterium]MDD2209901.1 hypothetical protein [Candidatus Cloacimonadota bacterium]